MPIVDSRARTALATSLALTSRLVTSAEPSARAGTRLAGDRGAAGKLVQELVDEAIDRYAELASVKKALEARREQVAADEGKLSHLRAKRGAAGATPDVPSS